MDENILHTPDINLTKRTKKLEETEDVRQEKEQSCSDIRDDS